MEWMQFEVAMRREAFQLIVLVTFAYVAGFAMSMYVLYIVIKYAIKHGINESRLTDNWRTRVTRESSRTHDGDTLPPMRAD